MIYKINLTKENNTEPFEISKDNVAEITIQGKTQVQKNCKVELSISKNAMLGLGTELIRYYFEKGKMGNPLDLFPSEPHEPIVETLGITLAPGSMITIIGQDEFGSIDNVLKQKEQE